MPKTLTASSGRAIPKWVEAAFEVHAARYETDDYATAVEGIHEADRCWCCGAKAKLQQCHIIPKALGGSAAAENIVPLCALCHDEAPDVAHPEEMWRWIKSQHNGLTGLGLGRMEYVLELTAELCVKHNPTGPEIPALYEWMEHLAKQKINTHWGQHGQGCYIKESTMKWVIREAFRRATCR